MSNHVGPNGEPVDRIYGAPAVGLKMRLVQADYTEYKGGIHKKSIIKTDTKGERFRSYVYVTDDGRYFSRAGLPILPPEQVEEDDSTE